MFQVALDEAAMTAIEVKNLSVYYGRFQALKDVSMTIEKQKITALIGPSGCGKTTFLRSLNRMNDLVEGAKVVGEVFIDGLNIYRQDIDLLNLRRRVGMVFQRPNPFPLSIEANILYGLKVHGVTDNKIMQEKLETSLRAVQLWSEVKDLLQKNALSLSLEQQQRLCLARLLAVEPDILLMDEPCSALDPIATSRIEELMFELKKKYTIVIVTHNMQQAARVSDFTGYFLLGELVEFGETKQVFTAPADRRTGDYITGRYG